MSDGIFTGEGSPLFVVIAVMIRDRLKLDVSVQGQQVDVRLKDGSKVCEIIRSERFSVCVVSNDCDGRRVSTAASLLDHVRKLRDDVRRSGVRDLEAEVEQYWSAKAELKKLRADFERIEAELRDRQKTASALAEGMSKASWVREKAQLHGRIFDLEQQLEAKTREVPAEPSEMAAELREIRKLVGLPTATNDDWSTLNLTRALIRELEHERAYLVDIANMKLMSLASQEVARACAKELVAEALARTRRVEDARGGREDAPPAAGPSRG